MSEEDDKQIKLLCIVDLKEKIYLTIESNTVVVDKHDYDKIIKLLPEIKDFKELESKTKKYDFKFTLDTVKQITKKDLENKFINNKNKSIEFIVFNLTTEKITIKTETKDTIVISKQTLNVNKTLKKYSAEKQITNTLLVILGIIGLTGLISIFFTFN